MGQQSKMVRIEFETEDGEIVRVRGDAAEEWSQTLTSALTFQQIHNGCNCGMPEHEIQHPDGRIEVVPAEAAQQMRFTPWTGKAS